MINLIWLAAVIGFAIAGYVPGLLGLIAFFLMDLAIDVKQLRRAVTTWVQADLALMTHEAADRDADGPSSDTRTGAALKGAGYQPTPNDRAFAELCAATGVAIHRVDSGGDV